MLYLKYSTDTGLDRLKWHARQFMYVCKRLA